MLLTNRGKPRDTWEAWEFYREVRKRFGRWARVELTSAPNPYWPQSSATEAKVVRFVDGDSNALELYGVNFGYEGGTPAEVVKTLVREGFNEAAVTAAVFNRSGAQAYPQALERSASR